MTLFSILNMIKKQTLNLENPIALKKCALWERTYPSGYGGFNTHGRRQTSGANLFQFMEPLG